MADRWQHTTDGYSFRFFSPEQADQILRDGARRGRDGSHAAIERILKHEPGLQRAELWRRIRWLKASKPAEKYRRTIWNPEDEKTLRDGYQRGWRGKREAVCELLQRHPDWCPHVVWRRAAKLGLVRQSIKRRPDRYRQPWSEEDDRTLLNLAGYKRMSVIAKLLHRPERGVRYRLAVLGKSSRVQLEGYARRALAEELHLGRKTIQRLIATGLLEVRDPRITPESLEALRSSGRLTGLQLHHQEAEGVSQTDTARETSAPPDESNQSSGNVTQSAVPNTRKASRAERVWTEVAQALGVSFETVRNLIVDRTLKVFDPRITERSLINLCRRNGSLINWEFLDAETRDWLQSSMDLDRRTGIDATKRLNPFRKHALVVRKCTQCGRAIRGNAFFAHSKCRKDSSKLVRESANGTN
jgi:hypothetical protein